MKTNKAPREVSMLVAEHIFGYQWVNRASEETSELVDQKTIKDLHLAAESRPSFDSVRYYGSDFASETQSSKRLRDKMRAVGWLYSIRVLGTGEICAQFWKGMGSSEMDQQSMGVANEDAEEMAVALAALRAYGVKV